MVRIFPCPQCVPTLSPKINIFMGTCKTSIHAGLRSISPVVPMSPNFFSGFPLSLHRFDADDRLPALTGGGKSDIGRLSAHSSTSRTSQATRRGEIFRGAGNSPDRTMRCRLVVEIESRITTSSSETNSGFISERLGRFESTRLMLLPD